MSFSSDVKKELCRSLDGKKCCALAEAYGVLLYCNTFTGSQIKIITENEDFTLRLPALFRMVFNLTFDAEPDKLEGKRGFAIDNEVKLKTIFEPLGYEPDKGIAHHINFAILEEDCCKASFIRGAFLAGGSVTDPEKRYHFELVTSHYNVGRETYSLLLELDFEPKNMARGGNFITYFKQSEAIEDILTAMGAPISAMRIMNAKLEKDLRNSVNRKVNCDTANLEKVVNASIDQADAIKKLIDSGVFDSLSDKLRQTALLRLNNPESSIAELAQMSNPPVTKSCLSHRLRRLKEIYNSNLRIEN